MECLNYKAGCGVHKCHIPTWNVHCNMMKSVVFIYAFIKLSQICIATRYIQNNLFPRKLYISRHLKEKLAWVIDKRLWVIVI